MIDQSVLSLATTDQHVLIFQLVELLIHFSNQSPLQLQIIIFAWRSRGLQLCDILLGKSAVPVSCPLLIYISVNKYQIGEFTMVYSIYRALDLPQPERYIYIHIPAHTPRKPDPKRALLKRRGVSRITWACPTKCTFHFCI